MTERKAGRLLRPRTKGFTGRKHTLATKNKQRALMKGNTYGLGKKLSLETRTKISAARIGNKNALGVKRSSKTRNKMSEARFRFFRNGGRVPPNSGRGKVGFRKDIGHFVRSTWEANVCRIFRLLKLEYVYEPHIIRLPEIDSTYLPDFWIPDLQCYIEVRGWCNDLIRQKKPLLATLQGYPTIEIDIDHYERLRLKYREKISNWE